MSIGNHSAQDPGTRPVGSPHGDGTEDPLADADPRLPPAAAVDPDPEPTEQIGPLGTAAAPPTSYAEFELVGSVPRAENPPEARRTEDLYLRLEGRVYGPISVEEIEGLLSSGMLTGLESISGDLSTWTPLAYHPRMIANRQAGAEAAHRMLAQYSDLPSPAPAAASAQQRDTSPHAAILHRPAGVAETVAGDTRDAPAPPETPPPDAAVLRPPPSSVRRRPTQPSAAVERLRTGPLEAIVPPDPTPADEHGPDDPASTGPRLTVPIVLLVGGTALFGSLAWLQC